jgi:homoserine dehydrogenase
MADRPGVLAGVTRVFGDHRTSIKSVVQRGLGESARLVMVTHPVFESQLRGALDEVGELEFVRGEPRMIRVIEEEFV